MPVYRGYRNFHSCPILGLSYHSWPRCAGPAGVSPAVQVGMVHTEGGQVEVGGALQMVSGLVVDTC